MNQKQLQFIFCLLLVYILLAWQSAIAKQVILATSEREPYIGVNLPNKGYVHELVTESFKKVGYEVEINFYPLARAKHLAINGEIDGLVPTYYEKNMDNVFIFSMPFPGDNIGLLKKNSFSVSYDIDPGRDLTKALHGLKKYTFGVIRGNSISSEFDAADFIKKEFVAKDLLNLDKLFANRIDFVVIDKYTASDLMVNQRPDLIGQLDFMRPPLVRNSFYIAFSKKTKHYQTFVDDFNQGLSMLEKAGDVKRIQEKHGLFHPKSLNSDKKNLVIGVMGTDDIRIMKTLSSEFEKSHPDIELEWRFLNENTLRKRLLADLAISDGQFDIMMIGAYEAPIWGKNKWIIPIKDLPEDYDLNDIVKTVRKGLSYQNNLYALPYYAESTMTFYRKDLFEKAGLKMPDNPTYQEIMNFAKKIHDPENKIYGIGLRGKPGWGQNMAFISILVHTFGGRWFDEKWRATVDSEEWKNALSYYKEILDKYGHPDKVTNGWYENQKLFADGHLGIIIDATSLAGRLFNPKTSKVYDKIGFTSTPIALYPKGSQWLWSWALAIPVSSKLQKEATAFITWATSKQYVKLVAKSEGWVSVPPGARYSTYCKEYIDAAPFANYVIQAIQKANPVDFSVKPVPYTGLQFVAIPEFPAIGHQVGLSVAQILEGKISVEKALHESQKVLNEQMRRSGYLNNGVTH